MELESVKEGTLHTVIDKLVATGDEFCLLHKNIAQKESSQTCSLPSSENEHYNDNELLFFLLFSKVTRLNFQNNP